MDFHTMKRKQLQDLCKKHGIPANLTNVEMVNKLSLLFKEQSKLNKEEQAKPKAGGKSCLKNLVEVASDDDSNKDTRKKNKKVTFSPENDTFEFVDLTVDSDKKPPPTKRASRSMSTSVEKTEVSEGHVDKLPRVTRSRAQNSKNVDVVTVPSPPPGKQNARNAKKTKSQGVKKIDEVDNHQPEAEPGLQLEEPSRDIGRKRKSAAQTLLENKRPRQNISLEDRPSESERGVTNGPPRRTRRNTIFNADLRTNDTVESTETVKEASVREVQVRKSRRNTSKSDSTATSDLMDEVPDAVEGKEAKKNSDSLMELKEPLPAEESLIREDHVRKSSRNTSKSDAKASLDATANAAGQKEQKKPKRKAVPREETVAECEPLTEDHTRLSTHNASKFEQTASEDATGKSFEEKEPLRDLTVHISDPPRKSRRNASKSEQIAVVGSVGKTLKETQPQEVSTVQISDPPRKSRRNASKFEQTASEDATGKSFEEKEPLRDSTVHISDPPRKSRRNASKSEQIADVGSVGKTLEETQPQEVSTVQISDPPRKSRRNASKSGQIMVVGSTSTTLEETQAQVVSTMQISEHPRKSTRNASKHKQIAVLASTGKTLEKRLPQNESTVPISELDAILVEEPQVVDAGGNMVDTAKSSSELGIHNQGKKVAKGSKKRKWQPKVKPSLKKQNSNVEFHTAMFDTEEISDPTTVNLEEIPAPNSAKTLSATTNQVTEKCGSEPVVAQANEGISIGDVMSQDRRDDTSYKNSVESPVDGMSFVLQSHSSDKSTPVMDFGKELVAAETSVGTDVHPHYIVDEYGAEDDVKSVPMEQNPNEFEDAGGSVEPNMLESVNEDTVSKQNESVGLRKMLENCSEIAGDAGLIVCSDGDGLVATPITASKTIGIVDNAMSSGENMITSVDKECKLDGDLKLLFSTPSCTPVANRREKMTCLESEAVTGSLSEGKCVIASDMMTEMYSEATSENVEATESGDNLTARKESRLSNISEEITDVVSGVNLDEEGQPAKYCTSGGSCDLKKNMDVVSQVEVLSMINPEGGNDRLGESPTPLTAPKSSGIVCKALSSGVNLIATAEEDHGQDDGQLNLLFSTPASTLAATRREETTCLEVETVVGTMSKGGDNIASGMVTRMFSQVISTEVVGVKESGIKMAAEKGIATSVICKEIKDEGSTGDLDAEFTGAGDGMNDEGSRGDLDAEFIGAGDSIHHVLDEPSSEGGLFVGGKESGGSKVNTYEEGRKHTPIAEEMEQADAEKLGIYEVDLPADNAVAKDEQTECAVTNAAAAVTLISTPETQGSSGYNGMSEYSLSKGDVILGQEGDRPELPPIHTYSVERGVALDKSSYAGGDALEEKPSEGQYSEYKFGKDVLNKVMDEVSLPQSASDALMPEDVEPTNEEVEIIEGENNSGDKSYGSMTVISELEFHNRSLVKNTPVATNKRMDMLKEFEKGGSSLAVGSTEPSNFFNYKDEVVETTNLNASGASHESVGTDNEHSEGKLSAVKIPVVTKIGMDMPMSVEKGGSSVATGPGESCPTLVYGLEVPHIVNIGSSSSSDETVGTDGEDSEEILLADETPVATNMGMDMLVAEKGGSSLPAVPVESCQVLDHGVHVARMMNDDGDSEGKLSAEKTPAATNVMDLLKGVGNCGSSLQAVPGEPKQLLTYGHEVSHKKKIGASGALGTSEDSEDSEGGEKGGSLPVDLEKPTHVATDMGIDILKGGKKGRSSPVGPEKPSQDLDSGAQVALSMKTGASGSLDGTVGTNGTHGTEGEESKGSSLAAKISEATMKRKYMLKGGEQGGSLLLAGPDETSMVLDYGHDDPHMMDVDASDASDETIDTDGEDSELMLVTKSKQHSYEAECDSLHKHSQESVDKGSSIASGSEHNEDADRWESEAGEDSVGGKSLVKLFADTPSCLKSLAGSSIGGEYESHVYKDGSHGAEERVVPYANRGNSPMAMEPIHEDNEIMVESMGAEKGSYGFEEGNDVAREEFGPHVNAMEADRDCSTDIKLLQDNQSMNDGNNNEEEGDASYKYYGRGIYASPSEEFGDFDDSCDASPVTPGMSGHWSAFSSDSKVESSVYSRREINLLGIEEDKEFNAEEMEASIARGNNEESRKESVTTGQQESIHDRKESTSSTKSMLKGNFSEVKSATKRSATSFSNVIGNSPILKEKEDKAEKSVGKEESNQVFNVGPHVNAMEADDCSTDIKPLHDNQRMNDGINSEEEGDASYKYHGRDIYASPSEEFGDFDDSCDASPVTPGMSGHWSAFSSDSKVESSVYSRREINLLGIEEDKEFNAEVMEASIAGGSNEDSRKESVTTGQQESTPSSNSVLKGNFSEVKSVTKRSATSFSNVIGNSPFLKEKEEKAEKSVGKEESNQVFNVGPHVNAMEADSKNDGNNSEEEGDASYKYHGRDIYASPSLEFGDFDDSCDASPVTPGMSGHWSAFSSDSKVESSVYSRREINLLGIEEDKEFNAEVMEASIARGSNEDSRKERVATGQQESIHDTKESTPSSNSVLKGNFSEVKSVTKRSATSFSNVIGNSPFLKEEEDKAEKSVGKEESNRVFNVDFGSWVEKETKISKGESREQLDYRFEDLDDCSWMFEVEKQHMANEVAAHIHTQAAFSNEPGSDFGEGSMEKTTDQSGTNTKGSSGPALGMVDHHQGPVHSVANKGEEAEGELSKKKNRKAKVEYSQSMSVKQSSMKKSSRSSLVLKTPKKLFNSDDMKENPPQSVKREQTGNNTAAKSVTKRRALEQI